MGLLRTLGQRCWPNNSHFSWRIGGGGEGEGLLYSAVNARRLCAGALLAIRMILQLRSSPAAACPAPERTPYIVYRHITRVHEKEYGSKTSADVTTARPSDHQRQANIVGRQASPRTENCMEWNGMGHVRQ